MEVEVEICSCQKYEQEEQKEITKYVGNLQTFEKGSIVSFGTKEQPNAFRCTIQKDKVILESKEQRMVFQEGRKTNSVRKTDYGNVLMSIATDTIQIEESLENLKKITLIYTLTLEEKITYENEVQIQMK